MPQSSARQDSKTQKSEILRTLSDDKAFYFYNGINAPLGVKANSLEDFALNVGNVSATCIEFHVKRHDFENWIKMLGDVTLAEQIMAIGSKDLPPLQSQQQIVKTVQLRLSDIKKKRQADHSKTRRA